MTRYTFWALVIRFQRSPQSLHLSVDITPEFLNLQGLAVCGKRLQLFNVYELCSGARYAATVSTRPSSPISYGTTSYGTPLYGLTSCGMTFCRVFSYKTTLRRGTSYEGSPINDASRLATGDLLPVDNIALCSEL